LREILGLRDEEKVIGGGPKEPNPNPNPNPNLKVIGGGPKEFLERDRFDNPARLTSISYIFSLPFCLVTIAYTARFDKPDCNYLYRTEACQRLPVTKPNPNPKPKPNLEAWRKKVGMTWDKPVQTSLKFEFMNEFMGRSIANTCHKHLTLDRNTKQLRFTPKPNPNPNPITLIGEF